MVAMKDRATVYGPSADTGEYTVVLRENLQCDMMHLDVGAARNAFDREALAQGRRLRWDRSFRMPEDCRVVCRGALWQAVAGTFGTFNGPTGVPVYRACELRLIPGGVVPE
jgi:hypothetical protein